MAKVFTLLYRKPGWNHRQFSDYWAGTHREHALDLARAGFFTGYVQNHLVSQVQDSTWPAADGIPEIWVPSVDSLAEIAASEVYQNGAAPDEANFTTGVVDSYIAEAGSEQGLSRLASPVSELRHLVFLQAESAELVSRKLAELELGGAADAVDIFQTTSAADGHTPYMVLSGFWSSMEDARTGLDCIIYKLSEVAGLRPLNAGIYETRRVVDPSTGKWD